MAESTAYAVKARAEMVHRILEGFREQAFELARDIGIESLTAPRGLRAFIDKMRSIVLPRAADKARRELFRAGQRQGALARQGGKSMLSHTSRRRRWWKLLRSLDSSIELSGVELLPELEALIVKACTNECVLPIVVCSCPRDAP